MKETDTDFGALYSKLESNIKDGMDEDKRRVHEELSSVTTNYQQIKSRLLHLLLRFLQQIERNNADFLQPVEIGKEAVPKLFNIFAGEPHPGKKACFNAMMKDWTLNRDALLNVTELKKGECPHVKPSTFITCMKGLPFEL